MMIGGVLDCYFAKSCRGEPGNIQTRRRECHQKQSTKELTAGAVFLFESLSVRVICYQIYHAWIACCRLSFTKAEKGCRNFSNQMVLVDRQGSEIDSAVS